MKTCFVVREYNPITEKYQLRILNLHEDNLHPCAVNPDPLKNIHKNWEIVSGYEALNLGEARKYVETAEE